MGCPVCWVCASCKWSCRCWLRSSQVRTLSQIFKNTTITKTNEVVSEIISMLVLRKTYEDIKTFLKEERWITFKDEYTKAAKSVQNLPHNHIYEGWCFDNIEEWRKKLGMTDTKCSFWGIAARDRCKYCNTQKFYQTESICLAITNNLCPEIAAENQ